MTFMSHILQFITSCLPFGSSALFQLTYFVFVVLIGVNIILSVIWVINQIKSLFSLV